MNRIDADYIQSKINYHFKNLQLLQQAFTRKSYSVEHSEVQNNEVLEFYGDEILDFIVAKKLYKKFSKIVNKEFVSQKNEGELTKLKSIIVSKESLARCIYASDFSKFLVVGKSDEQNEVEKSLSVNEDLFEAIIGAVAVDSDWNYETLEQVCETMLQMETTNSYLTILVREKSIRLGFGEPCEHPMNWQVEKLEDFEPKNLYNTIYLGMDELRSSKNPKTGNSEYWIDIGGNKFKGIGNGALQAKLDADKKAYQFLCQEEIKRQFANIDYDNPVSTLHELFQKNVILEVRYEFNEYHDENGNPIWNCKATLEGYGSFSADDASKKKVKQEAANKLLHFITDTVIEKSDKWDIPEIRSGDVRFWSDEMIAEMDAEFNKAFPDWGK